MNFIFNKIVFILVSYTKLVYLVDVNAGIKVRRNNKTENWDFWLFIVSECLLVLKNSLKGVFIWTSTVNGTSQVNRAKLGWRQRLFHLLNCFSRGLELLGGTAEWVTLWTGWRSFVTVFLISENSKLKEFNWNFLDLLELAIGVEIPLSTAKFYWKDVLSLTIGLDQIEIHIGHLEGIVDGAIVQEI